MSRERNSRAVSLRNRTDEELWKKAQNKATSLDLNLSQVIRHLLRIWTDDEIEISINVNNELS